MPTRITYKKAILEVLSQRDPVTRLLPIPCTTTALGGSSGVTIISSQLIRGLGGSVSGNRYDGRFFEIIELVASGPPIGEESVAQDGQFGSATGALATSPAFTLQVQTATDFLVYPKGFSPMDLESAIDAVMRLTDAPQAWYPSIFDDADFLEDDLTNWVQVLTPTTREFVITAPNILQGERALHIVADEADAGAQSNAAEVTEGQQLVISIHVQVAVGSAKIQLWNETAGEEIKAVTVDEQEHAEVRFMVAVPADCEQVSIRFLGTANLDEFYVSPYIIGQPQTDREYAAPSWMRQNNIEKAFSLPQGVASEDADSYIALSRRIRDSVSYRLSRSERDVTPQRVSVRAVGGQPTGFLVHRALSALSADTSTSPLDQDYVVARALQNLFERRQDAEWRHWRGRANELAKTHGYGKRAIQVTPNGQVGV